MTIYTLDLEFDINQITRSLQYTFSNSKKKTGILAGTFNFDHTTTTGEDFLEVSLTATGNAAGNPSVIVQDCTLVSVSNGDLGRTFLSPFSQKNAVSQFSGWAPLENKKAPKGRVKLFGSPKIGAPNSRLPVVAQTGQWEMSGYLSVVIVLDGKNYNRVFTFDPESTAGGGAGLGWPG